MSILSDNAGGRFILPFPIGLNGGVSELAAGDFTILSAWPSHDVPELVSGDINHRLDLVPDREGGHVFEPRIPVLVRRQLIAKANSDAAMPTPAGHKSVTRITPAF